MAPKQSARIAMDKRTNLPRPSNYSRVFVKDWERLSRSGRYDMRRLKEAMLLLISAEAPLAPEWLDHSLNGEWEGYKECHIGGDFLLLYRIHENGLLVFVHTGTHSELFGK